MIDVASWWPELISALSNDDAMFSDICTHMTSTCPSGDADLVCEDCDAFVVQFGQLDPVSIDEIAAEAVAYLQGPGYCAGGGLNNKPENCADFVTVVSDIFPVMIPYFDDPRTADRYCDNVLCPFRRGETRRMLDGMQAGYYYMYFI